MTYTVKPETWRGIGGGVNGTGRRPKRTGFAVYNPEGRRVRVFEGVAAERLAAAWADFCNHNFPARAAIANHAT